MDEPKRRFTLSDVCVLIAAIGAGLALARYYVDQHRSMFVGREDWLTWLVAIGGGMSLPLSAAVLILRLKRPRPPWREIGSQPGVLACLMILLKAAITTSLYAFRWTTPGKRTDLTWWNWLGTIVFPGDYVPLIVVSWVTLLLTGRYRAERSVIDRLGRFLGWSCIVIYLIAWTTRFFR